MGFAIEVAVQALVVCGRLSGGPREGLPFATKGGLIGKPDAISESVLQLQSMPPPGSGPRADHHPGEPARSAPHLSRDQEVVT
jgi:hypothetical protein